MKKSIIVTGVLWSTLATPLVLVLGLVLVLATTCVHAPGVSSFSSSDVVVQPWESKQSTQRGHWYYVETPEAVCANGTPAGMGLNVGGSQSDVVLYLSGGGACWDSASCSYFQTAANLDVTYDADQLSDELHPLIDSGLLDRGADVNHWQTASYAYLPYCTADLHTGRTTTSYGGFGSGSEVHHRGADNIEVYLEKLAHLFPDVERIWVVGISAGGYGASWHFPALRNTFPDAEVHLFTDAAPWLSVEADRLEQWRNSWEMEPPIGCERCIDVPDYLPTYLATEYPDSRFAMSVYSRDPVLSAYLGVLPRTVDQSIDEFVEERFSHDNTRVFVASGMEHETLLNLDDNIRSDDGDELSYFMWRWIAGW